MHKNKKIKNRIDETLNSQKPSRKVLDNALSEMDASNKVKKYSKKRKIAIALVSACFMLLISIIPLIYSMNKMDDHFVETTLKAKTIVSIENYVNENVDKLKGGLLYYDYQVLESLLFQDGNKDVYISEKYQVDEAVIYLNVLLSSVDLKVFDDLKIQDGISNTVIMESISVKYNYYAKEKKFSGEFIYGEYNYLLNINGIDENLAKEYVSILIK